MYEQYELLIPHARYESNLQIARQTRGGWVDKRYRMISEQVSQKPGVFGIVNLYTAGISMVVVSVIILYQSTVAVKY